MLRPDTETPRKLGRSDGKGDWSRLPRGGFASYVAVRAGLRFDGTTANSGLLSALRRITSLRQTPSLWRRLRSPRREPDGSKSAHPTPGKPDPNSNICRGVQIVKSLHMISLILNWFHSRDRWVVACVNCSHLIKSMWRQFFSFRFPL